MQIVIIAQHLRVVLASILVFVVASYLSSHPRGTMSKVNALKIVPRRSSTRGHAHHGWLKTYHTFSFASYYDSNFEEFGALRVINEDRVDPAEGFGRHSHREFEIFSYIVDGELEHRDSMGNLEIMRPGDIQMTSTGTGISHSEYNRHASQPVHFLQIWVKPNQPRLPPAYFNRHFTREAKLDRLVKVVAPTTDSDVDADARNGDGPAPVHANLSMFASILSSPSASSSSPEGAGRAPPLSHTLAVSTKRAYVHNIMKSGYRGPNVAAGDKFEDGGAKLRINGGLVLEEGDGAFITTPTLVSPGEDVKLEFDNVGAREVEFLLFEMTD